AALGEIETVARAAADAVVRDPMQPRQIDAALQHQILDEAADWVVDERRDNRGAQVEAAPQAARDVVLAAAFPHLERAGRGHAAVAGVEAQHHFAKADEVVASGIVDLHFRDASNPEPPCAYSGCTLTTPNWRSWPSRFAAIIQ